jgi:DNA repair exonuclease SbcCD ATPase subunit
MDDTFYERARYRAPAEYGYEAHTGIEQEVKLLYARGEIDSGTYYRLIDMAQSGQLNWSDLDRIEKKTGPGNGVEQRKPPKRDVEIVSDLNQLYSHRKQLESARQETETVLQTLENEAARLAEQVKSAESKAKQAIDNEDAARAYLNTRQKALERADIVQERINELRQNLSRIENLEADISTREAELKALESGERLAELEADIRKDLLSNE